MAKKIELNNDLQFKINDFVKKLESEMIYQSNFSSDEMSFDWITEISFACKYLDNIVRNPKVLLMKEEDIVKIEKAQKITVASVKDLTQNTQYIDEVDPITEDIKPSKILIERSEETFNSYENRFIYTLLKNLDLFIAKKEDALKRLEIDNDKVLEYQANTITGSEKINIELKITANKIAGNKTVDKEIDSLRKQMKLIKEYMAMWRNSEFIKSLDKARALLVSPPIKKNNVILKNPNFQVAMKLWDFLQNYEEGNNDYNHQDLNTSGNAILKGLLDDAFLTDYFVFDAISKSKREQKEKLADYAVIMIHQQIKRIIELLINSGIKVTDDQIKDLITQTLQVEKQQREVSSNDVKRKFQTMLDEYLEKTQNY